MIFWKKECKKYVQCIQFKEYWKCFDNVEEKGEKIECGMYGKYGKNGKLELRVAKLSLNSMSIQVNSIHLRQR